MRPALEAVFDQLESSAPLAGVVVPEALDKQQIISQLMDVLEIFEPKKRLDAMVALMEQSDLLPLPGHGEARGHSIDWWLEAAGR